MPACPKVVDEDEGAYAGDRMSSSEHAPAAAPSSTLLSDARPLARTSNSAMTDIHDIDSFFAPRGNPARLNAGASLARSPSAWTDGTPSTRIVPATSSGAVVQSTQHALHDAPVRASCWSYPGALAGLWPQVASLRVLGSCLFSFFIIVSWGLTSHEAH